MMSDSAKSDRDKMSLDLLNQAKKDGNDAFAEGNYEMAATLYEAGIRWEAAIRRSGNGETSTGVTVDPATSYEPEQQLHSPPLDVQQIRAVLMSNLAASRLKLGNWAEAVAAATSAIDEGADEKALEWRAIGFSKMNNKEEESYRDYKNLLEKCPARIDLEGVILQMETSIWEREWDDGWEESGKTEDESLNEEGGREESVSATRYTPNEQVRFDNFWDETSGDAFAAFAARAASTATDSVSRIEASLRALSFFLAPSDPIFTAVLKDLQSARNSAERAILAAQASSQHNSNGNVPQARAAADAASCEAAGAAKAASSVTVSMWNARRKFERRKEEFEKMKKLKLEQHKGGPIYFGYATAGKTSSGLIVQDWVLLRLAAAARKVERCKKRPLSPILQQQAAAAADVADGPTMADLQQAEVEKASESEDDVMSSNRAVRTMQQPAAAPAASPEVNEASKETVEEEKVDG
ncbi:hypothetical protein PENTCL1PPCAC_24216 [Pristionchus entomophagus]|uniref:Uncharacterized protein n=1 Tax=Pristionchus entomophagus TaxID=358040 RepID=A0AAV5U689_9BILA|nr:hypothetical protein PENTCL1PPCAC_24216 [Pristionchus entomophagus]